MPRKKKDKGILAQYLMLEYLKEMSNEITYLVLVVAALFLFMLVDIIPDLTGQAPIAGYTAIRTIFVLLVIGGFALFGVSNITKRKIEKRFAEILE